MLVLDMVNWVFEMSVICLVASSCNCASRIKRHDSIEIILGAVSNHKSVRKPWTGGKLIKVNLSATHVNGANTT